MSNNLLVEIFLLIRRLSLSQFKNSLKILKSLQHFKAKKGIKKYKEMRGDLQKLKTNNTISSVLKRNQYKTSKMSL